MALPRYVVRYYGSTRAFKATKRRQLATVQKAVDQLRVGCSYIPGGSGPIYELDRVLQGLRDNLCAKAWGH